MADYSSQQNRTYNSRAVSHGHPTTVQRDAAFADIFGGAPPGARSHTMTSQSPLPPQDRAYTMASQPPNGMVSRGPPPIRHLQNGYDRAQPNGYYPGGRQPNGTAGPPPPQNLPAPMFPDRRPYPQPQRLDPRQGGGIQPFPNKPPNRVPAPALNSDPYRSQSMATTTQSMARMAGPGTYQPNVSNFNHTSASAFRQQQYQNIGPRTTSMGRHIPERHDERTMSMSSYTSHPDSTQLGSGRVIPVVPRRNQVNTDPGPVPAHTRSPESFNSSSPSPQEEMSRFDTGNRPRRPSDGSIGRSMSMASNTTTLIPDRTMSLQSRPNLSHSPSTTTTVAPRRAPLVYPALLSRVADVFQERIGVGERIKNDLTYKNAFTGGEAVDLICYVIKTTDRNLALLLGRALDAQKFFHDVTYDHRLRDATGEVYQFRETIGEEAPSSEVNGVFTLLSECYSPTCTRDQLCYSIACPRRLEQQARLNLKPEPGLRSSTSKGSLHDTDDTEQKLWVNSVPKEIADSLDDKEKKRQEVISEIMYTERDFVKDLEYLRDYWVRPLRSNNPNNPSPIPPHRQEKFIRTVFGNFLEVYNVNKVFSERLTARQRESPVVENIGDIFLDFVHKFDPFIKYGANQMYGRYEFEKEKGHNPVFARFVDETERLKESRKLELNGYLTKPTTRLGRYPLLLEQVLKCTKDNNRDRRDIPEAVKVIKDFLGRVNAETGKAENHFNLVQLSQQLKWNPGEFVDLKLTEENRQILSKMNFKKNPTDTSEITVYLFDHAVLPIRIKTVNKREEYRVYRKPIPLELLLIAEMDQVIPRLGVVKRPSSSLIPGTKSSNAAGTQDKQGFPITFRNLGRGAYELPLYASSQVQRKRFIEQVEQQQSKLRQRNSNIYSKTIICENFFTSANRVNCLVPSGKSYFIIHDLKLTVARWWPQACLWH